MYCPECGAENRKNQQYCRQCGISLRPVNLALEGRVTEASAVLSKHIDRLGGGIVTLLIFTVIALISSFFDRGSAIVNLILGLVIGGPMILSGLRHISKAVELISVKDEHGVRSDARPAIDSHHPASLPTAVSFDTADHDAPGSISESTTARLKVPVR